MKNPSLEQLKSKIKYGEKLYEQLSLVIEQLEEEFMTDLDLSTEEKIRKQSQALKISIEESRERRKKCGKLLMELRSERYLTRLAIQAKKERAEKLEKGRIAS